jgi:hypothetical protein
MVERLSVEPVKALVEMIIDQPGPTMIKSAVSGWRYLTVFAIILFVLFSSRRGAQSVSVFAWLAIAYAVLRTTVLGEIVQVETRLILPAAAWLEIALALEIARLIGRRRELTQNLSVRTP